MSESKIIDFQDESFEAEMTRTKQYVLVDFWAEWCSPCLVMADLLVEIADEYSKKLSIGKVNIDNNPEIPMQFGVRSIPTLLILKDGKTIATKIGPVNKTELKKFIDDNI